MSRISVRIERVDAGMSDDVIATTLDLVLRGLPDDVRHGFRDGIRLAARSNPESLGELWRALDLSQGATIGAVWAQLRPGGTALVWPPQWSVVAAEAAGPDPLLTALLPVLSVRGTTLAQSLLVDRRSPEAATLEASGFRHAADLCYLAVDVGTQELPTSGGVPPLEYAPIDAASWSRLIEIVDESYAETLDCPALNGLRGTAEALDEYRTIGASGAQLWRLVRHAGSDVGCLLLADHPLQDQVELVYMGLKPGARGRGWGEFVVREALRMARESRRARVVLAVDAANWPAAAMYERAGFAEFDRRTVMIFTPGTAAKKT